MKKFNALANRLKVFFLLAVTFMIFDPVSESRVWGQQDLLKDPSSIEARLAEIIKEAKENPENSADIASEFARQVPDKAVEIASRVAEAVPHEYAADIAARIASIVPEKAAEIAARVAGAVPHEYAADIAAWVALMVPGAAADIAYRVGEVAPEYKDSIEKSVADAIVRSEEGTPPPAPPRPPPYGQ